MSTERTHPPSALVISYHFPPDGSVGGLRWAGLTKYLARRGWEIDVVTASPQTSQAAEPGVRIHYCARRRTLNDAYKDWVGRHRAQAQTDTPSRMSGPIPEIEIGLVRSLRRNLSIALSFPDFGRGWILRSAAVARGLLRTGEYKAVITSGPPHSSHLAGMLACLGRSSIQWVDMRDPWAAMIEEGPDKKSRAKNWINRLIPHLERLVMRRACTVITNTEEFARELEARADTPRVFYLPNGVDVERLPAPTTKFPGLSISYAGTMYLGRDLTPVIRAMKAFLDEHSEARDAIKLRVAGNMDADHLSRFSSEVTAAGLTDAVELCGRIAPAEALDLINGSHLTLVLAQRQPVQIPAKLYECVAMNVPTLVIAESSSAAAREARRVGALTCEPTDIDSMRRIIAQLWANPSASLVAAGAPIAYEAIAAELESLFLGSRADRRARWPTANSATATRRSVESAP